VDFLAAVFSNADSEASFTGITKFHRHEMEMERK
jgi:hypothetical protein